MTCTPRTKTHQHTKPLITSTVQLGAPSSAPSFKPLINCNTRYASYTTGVTSHTGDSQCHVSISVSICTPRSKRYGPKRIPKEIGEM
ncbi:hypothetical protein HanPSC8_Chr13g0590501 [Helianthus annuus]|nr:hypothetical protein HanPSC8_Chr13g0590501 [Helianthus annuus]